MTRTCPQCGTSTTFAWCCGIDLTARTPWLMTAERVRAVHILARVVKGLDEPTYRLNLASVGVDSSKQLSREQFRQLMDKLRSMPDAPRKDAVA